jgi:uncharacterized protein YegP (UPF0339 family)
MKRAKYVIKRNAAGQFYFVLLAVNGEPLSTGEAYTNLWDAKRGAKAHRKAARSARIEVRI